MKDATLGPAYRQLVDAVREQVVDRGVTVRQLFGQPDDHKLVSSLTLFAGVAADFRDDWTATVVGVNEILDRAAEEGLPRCAATQRLLADDADPGTAPFLELARELTRLQRRYHVASHEVSELGVRPEGIDDDTLAWWIAAHRAKWRRRFERSETIAITDPVEQVELRKSRLGKPPR